MPNKNPTDKRRLSWLNEGLAILAIAANGNQPMYVAQIARLAPSVTRSSVEGTEEPSKAAKSKKGMIGGGTKPGMTKATKRLHERGILIRTYAKAPKKKEESPHYSITPTIHNMTGILDIYGSWVIGDLRRSGFAPGIIESGMDQHLAKVLQAPKDDIRRLPKAEKDELSYLARKSTRALEVFLNPRFELRAPRSESRRDYDLVARLRRLRDAMHLAFAAEAASSPGLRIWEEGWDIDIDITTVVRSGGMTMTFKTMYDSKDFMRKPQRDDKEQSGSKAVRGGP